MEVALHPALLEDGRFEVKHCIGSGGFGVVFAVHGHAEQHERRAQGAKLQAVAARARRGELRGGKEGDANVKSAIEELTEEQIVAPMKMLRIYAP